jgi:lysophospholipase L1-like esterase
MNSQQIILRIIWVTMCLPLLVIFLPLAVYVKRTTIRLPEAEGKRSNQLDDENAIRLLHIGESTVAGVGVKSIASGFTVKIASTISAHTNTSVTWSAFGENGIRLHELNARLPEEIEKLAANCSRSAQNKDYDLAIVTMGVNDSTKFTSVKQCRSALIDTIKILKANTDGPIYFTQVPPLWQFPALPSPLKQLLGIRSLILDNELKAFCNQNNNVYYVGSKMNVEKEMMAIDGYHPSELGYQQWAEQITDQITPTLNLN